MTIPLTKTRIKGNQEDIYYKLVKLGLRNMTYRQDLGLFEESIGREYSRTIKSMIKIIKEQIGIVYYIEDFLERFRHIHKMTNLLGWRALGNRKYVEKLSPSMNIEMTDFACKIPLKYREGRKLLLAYIRRYHPEIARFTLSGHILTANSPWILYKTLSPSIKAINSLGIKIPYLQWYMKKSNCTDLENLPEIYEFQREGCRNSKLIQETPYKRILELNPDDKNRLMRLFNISVLEKRLELGEDGLRDYLLGKVEEVRARKGLRD